jgi:DNA polymerase-1
MTASPDLVLVDGSSYVYRAFHALPPLSNSRGEPTGAVHGVLNMLLKFVKDYQPRCIAVVFDASGKTFRDDLFAEYKAHRQPMPNDLRSQIEPLLSIIRAQGLPILRIEGVEADDVIGTLACRAAKAGKSVLISTGDKDMAQLVDGSITLVNTMTNSVLDRAGVKAKFDVLPEQIIDYLALVGDSSDNIPGIEKVGPKTAAKWLNQYETLDNLVASAAQITGKVGENLRAGLKTLELSRKLATIHVDLDLPLAHDQLTPAPPDTAKLRELYTRYELRMLLKQLEGGAGDDTPTDSSQSTARSVESGAGSVASSAGGTGSTLHVAPGRLAPGAPSPLAGVERQYESITRWEDLERWLGLLRTAELFAFDTETTNLDYMKAEIVGVSFGLERGKAAYVPLRHAIRARPSSSIATGCWPLSSRFSRIRSAASWGMI